MALIRSLNPDTHPARPPRTEVDCLYSTVASDRGDKLLRLATLGSDMRKLHPKPSQIIEIDQEMAKRIVAIVYETFPDLASQQE